MDVFVFRFNSPMLADTIRHLRDDYNMRIVCWSGSKKYFDALVASGEFEDTIFDNTYDSVRGLTPESVDMSEFEPVSKEMLDSVSLYEGQILRMMDGVDHDDNIPTRRKQDIYHQYLRYWYGMIKRYKPQAIIFGDIPHIAYQFVVYVIARNLGIPVVMPRVTQITGRQMTTSDIESYDRLLHIIDRMKDEDVSLDDLSPDVKKYYLKQTQASSEESSPFYMRSKFMNRLDRAWNILPPPATIFKHLKSGTFFSTGVNFFKTFRTKKRLANINPFGKSGFTLYRSYRTWKKRIDEVKKEYESLQQTPDWDEKYIYLPLHKQPECSTNAMGGAFVDQHMVVDMVSRALPDGWKVYVKESPVQWVGPRAHLGRYQGYYSRMAENQNVKIVPTNVSTYKLLNNAQAVATVTGTAAWEAVLRGKPALVFGYIWYMYCDGIFRISNMQQCDSAIQKIASGFLPDEKKVMRFLVAADRASYVAYQNKRWKGEIPFSDKENAKGIADAIYQELSFESQAL